jgi:hypothetical protein
MLIGTETVDAAVPPFPLTVNVHALDAVAVGAEIGVTVI